MPGTGTRGGTTLIEHHLEVLNEPQRRAVEHWGCPLLILAGAGSGKTRAITTKIAYLAERRSIPPWSMLAVTFTNKAAQEMRDRATAMLPAAAEANIRTFHSFCNWLLRRYGSRAGIDPGFSILDSADALSVLRDASGGGWAADELKAAADLIARAKDHGLRPSDDLDRLGAPVDLPLNELYAAYQEHLERSNGLDFGDLILRAIDLLSDEAGDEIAGRFRALLVDEYQDANRAQFQLLRLLARGDVYVCAVGDDDQSIYGFRGADVQAFLSFPDHFAGAEIIRLEQNYRSTPQILQVADCVVAGNRDRLGKRLWTENGSGPAPQLHELPDQEAEVRLCCELVDRDPDLETAILYRMNFQSQPFETAFRRLRIPYRLVGSIGFFERQEVKDALAYLILTVNPADTVAFRRAVATPRRSVGPKTVQRILAVEADASARPQVETLFDVGPPAVTVVDRARAVHGTLPRRARAGIGAFLELHRELCAMADHEPVASLVAAALERSGLAEHYARLDAVSGGSRLRNLEQLAASAEPFGSGPGELRRFLEAAGLHDAGGESDEEPRGAIRPVTLITMHNTKGLEFERVVITGLEEGVFPLLPGDRAADPGRPDPGQPDPGRTDRGLEEERRLFYVGVTRARRHLHLSTCARRTVFGQRRDQQMSRFLSEIPDRLLARDGANRGQGEAEDFPAGAEVYHEDYGSGVVTRRWSSAGSWFVTVRFATEHEGTFAVRYSALERIRS